MQASPINKLIRFEINNDFVLQFRLFYSQTAPFSGANLYADCRIGDALPASQSLALSEPDSGLLCLATNQTRSRNNKQLSKPGVPTLYVILVSRLVNS